MLHPPLLHLLHYSFAPAYCHLFPSPALALPQHQAFLFEICAHADGNNYPPPRPPKYEDHDDFIGDGDRDNDLAKTPTDAKALLMLGLKSRP